MSTWCPTGPSALAPVEARVMADPIRRTAGWAEQATPGIAVKEAIQLRQLHLDGGDGGVHLQSPLSEGFVKHRGRVQIGDV
jgi:hypothetical protein